jgi:hypothetical protein
MLERALGQTALASQSRGTAPESCPPIQSRQADVLAFDTRCANFAFNACGRLTLAALVTFPVLPPQPGLCRTR